MSKILLSGFLIMLISSCMNPEAQKKYIDKKFSDVNKTADEQYLKDKVLLKSRYESVIKNAIDTALYNKLARYYSELSATTLYIDSLKAVVKKLPKDDFESTDSVKSIFITGSTGKILLKKINTTYVLAEKLLPKQELRKKIAESKAKFTNDAEVINTWFTQSNSQSALWALYAFEQEVMKTGTDLFADYKNLMYDPYRTRP